jgi:release factor glutamine methyltransferase
MNNESPVEAAVWTFGRLLNWTTSYLDQREVEDGRLAAEVLLAHCVGCKRIDLYTRFENPLLGEPLDRFRSLVRRAADQEPVAYLVGEREFFSLPFVVTKDVLIPRPETELLVECVIDHYRKAGAARPRMLDLGTGSGCIAVTVLTELHEARAVATDISEAALVVARRNAERHGVVERCTFVRADRFDLPSEVVHEGEFDIVVSNPPYIAADSGDQVDRSVRQHEPKTAWTDGGDGLSFYRSIAAEGPRFLSQDGAVFVEIGDGQAKAVIEIMEAADVLSHTRTWRDRAVGAERVLMFSRGM